MENHKLTRIGTGCIAAGLILLLAALLLVCGNLRADHQAQQFSEEILSHLPTAAVPPQEDTPKGVQGAKDKLPLYVTVPDMKMGTVSIDGQPYIGRIDLPAISRSLPVMEDWSYPQLRMAPCRYLGSAYRDGFVIIGHNYRSHFGALKNLRAGDKVLFTDVEGHVFRYKVAVVEQLHPTDGEKLTEGNWALTLVTCTLGGSYRLAVRCLAS